MEELLLRDHPHHSAPMLAGMWGSVRVAGEDFDRFQESMRRLFGEVSFHNADVIFVTDTPFENVFRLQAFRKKAVLKTRWTFWT